MDTPVLRCVFESISGAKKIGDAFDKVIALKIDLWESLWTAILSPSWQRDKIAARLPTVEPLTKKSFHLLHTTLPLTLVLL